MNNVTGWNELYSGNLIGASYTMFNAALQGWFITLLFFGYLALLMYKTKSTALVVVGGLLFVGMYAVYLQTISIQIVAMIIVLTLSSLIYHYFQK